MVERARFSPEIRRGDWVRCVTGGAGVGFVVRVAKDGGWADVKWQSPELGEWSKRMRTSLLRVEHTVQMDGLTVIDMTRRAEMEGRS